MTDAIQRFGLVPNDPDHDNGPAIAEALSAGCAVELPPGTYWTSQIRPRGRKPWSLVGRGVACTFQSPADAVVLRALPGTPRIFRAVEVSPCCRMRNLAFEHDPELPANDRAQGIVIQACDGWDIRNLSFFGLRTGLYVVNSPGKEDEPGRRIWASSVRHVRAVRCEVGFEFIGAGKGTMGAFSLTDCATEKCPISLRVRDWCRGFRLSNFAEHRGLVSIHSSSVLIDGLYAELLPDDARVYPIRLKDSEISGRGIRGKARIENCRWTDCHRLGVYTPGTSGVPGVDDDADDDPIEN